MVQMLTFLFSNNMLKLQHLPRLQFGYAQRGHTLFYGLHEAPLNSLLRTLAVLCA